MSLVSFEYLKFYGAIKALSTSKRNVCSKAHFIYFDVHFSQISINDLHPKVSMHI